MKIIYFVIYNGLVYPVIFWTALIISAFNKKLRQSIKGKFDSFNVLKNYFNKFDTNSKTYWFHASSLGEFFQLKTVIEKLKEEQDDLICIVSFSSPSGFNHANSDAMDLKFYIPFDFPWTINRVLNMIKPKKIMFASYDLWPNLIWISRLKGIHVNLHSVKTKEGFLRDNQISQHI
ncbi:MAG: glycosyltransferase N-terminal domain-containing protein, partial [Candidatus Neomarinimicrobiota bacterium]